MSEKKGNPASHRLIIQLARFGDLMQTAPLVSAAKLAEPESEVHLLVDESLKSAAGMIDNVDEIHTFDRTAFSKELTGNQLSAAYLRAAEIARSLNHKRFDFVANITHTPESGYLVSLVDAGERSGTIGGRKGVWCGGNWSRLFRATLSRRDLGGFHLVDVHLKLAGLGSPARDKSWLKQPASTPSEIAGVHPLLTIQLGANNPLRTWSVANFAATAKYVLTAMPQLTIALVGSAGENRLADEFEHSFESKVVNLTGKTNIEELGGVLAASDAVLSGDTGTIHLAAALNVPTVGVYLGMARADDTAPYSQGAVIIEPVRECYPCPENHRCGHLSCHNDIPPQAVAKTIIRVLNKEERSPEFEINYQARITSFDDTGCLMLARENYEFPDSYRQSMRKFWLDEFSAVSPRIKVRNSEGKLTELAEIAGVVVQAVRTIEERNFKGNQLALANKQLRSALGILEKFALRRDEIGLLTALFQLELENLQGDSRHVAGLIRLAAENLHRRACCFPLKTDKTFVRLRTAV